MIGADDAIAALGAELAGGERHYLALGSYLDSVRQATPGMRLALIQATPSSDDLATAIIAASTEILCDELQLPFPAWTHGHAQEVPVFLWPARSPAARFAVMIDTPPAFAARNLFVPATVTARV